MRLLFVECKHGLCVNYRKNHSPCNKSLHNINKWKRKAEYTVQKLVVRGGNKLKGEMNLQGAKNSFLPLTAAAVLCDDKSVILNSPEISDSFSSLQILNYLGVRSKLIGNVAEIDPTGLHETEIPHEMMRKMRSSVIFSGALLGKAGKCKISFPGGCDIGSRPIDYHINAFSEMGVIVHKSDGNIFLEAPKGLHGAKINLPFPSVGATENIILACVLAQGETVIGNAAREPEISDLVKFLRKAGAKIKGEGTSEIIVNGVKKLSGTEFTVSPDRIAGITYLSLVAAAGGEILLKKADSYHMALPLSVLMQMGCRVKSFDDNIFLLSDGNIKNVPMIKTSVYPGFPTDAQAVIMAALCKGNGNTLFVENIFENRYRHTGELIRMGADIKVVGRVASVTGVKELYGARVEAPDLRGGAALIIAALSAEGETEISKAEYIDRGYENIDMNIKSLGGNIKRIN